MSPLPRAAYDLFCSPDVISNPWYVICCPWLNLNNRPIRERLAKNGKLISKLPNMKKSNLFPYKRFLVKPDVASVEFHSLKSCDKSEGFFVKTYFGRSCMIYIDGLLEIRFIDLALLEICLGCCLLFRAVLNSVLKRSRFPNTWYWIVIVVVNGGLQ